MPRARVDVNGWGKINYDVLFLTRDRNNDWATEYHATASEAGAVVGTERVGTERHCRGCTGLGVCGYRDVSEMGGCFAVAGVKL